WRRRRMCYCENPPGPRVMKRKSIANRIAELNPINALDRLLTKHNQPTVGEPNGEFDDMFSHLGRGNGDMPDERVGAGTAADSGTLTEPHHRTSHLWLSIERAMAANATKVSTALTACEYSHCRRAASKASGLAVQKFVVAFIGYVNLQKISCVAARQRAAVRDSLKTGRSLRTMKVCSKVSRSAAIIGIPKKAQPA